MLICYNFMVCGVSIMRNVQPLVQKAYITRDL